MKILIKMRMVLCLSILGSIGCFGQCYDFNTGDLDLYYDVLAEANVLELDLYDISDSCTLEDLILTGYPSWLSYTKRVVNDRFVFVISIDESTLDTTRSGTLTIRDLYNSFYGTIQITQSKACLQAWYPDLDEDGFGEYESDEIVLFEGDSPFPILTQIPIYACEAPNDVGKIWVINRDDNCIGEQGPISGCVFPTEPYEDRNWIRSRSFDVEGIIRAQNKNYLDGLGKRTQTQTLDFKNQRIWAHQTLYDIQGRPAIQTLSAPISDTNTNTDEAFAYKEDFIKNTNGGNYGLSDFDNSNLENPTEVSSSSNSYDLGRQYSPNNTNDDLQDITNRPYSRTIYSSLNPGTVLKTIGGNKIDTNGDGIGDSWKQGFSYTFPAAQEMQYVFGLGYFPSKELIKNLKDDLDNSNIDLFNLELTDLETNEEFSTLMYISSDKLVISYIYDLYRPSSGEPSKLFRLNSFSRRKTPSRSYPLVLGIYEIEPLEVNDFLKATKTINQDIHGTETVVFTDTDGKTLASARSGGDQQYEVLSLIGPQKYIDIHIPTGCENTLSFVGATASDFKIYNLKTETVLASNNNLLAGFYRIEYIGHSNINFPAYALINEQDNSVEPAFLENIGVRYKVNYYDYALNYYDKAGRLTKTTQPIGFDSSALSGFKNAAELNHSSATTFEYNSLGQLLSTTSPDQGSATFKYRKDGQIRFSQNSKQALAGEFSYTNYDALARPVESGVAVGDFSGLDSDVLAFAGTIKPEEQQETVYDLEDTAGLATVLDSDHSAHYGRQQFVAGNVAKTQNAQTTTWYSYDIYGRVEWLVQNIAGLGVKTIDYEYDPVTSAVTKVDFQRYSPGERFVHHYSYHEVSGELIQVQTSEDGNIYITHASYDYYETGALKRLELKDRSGNKLQGIDYVYNLAGQLKAINHPELDGDKDPGGDTDDAFGMVLDYYQGDYQRNTDFDLVNSNGVDQYNGNIKAMTWSTRKAEGFGVNTYYYKYNKNNWLEGAGWNHELQDSFTISDVEERSAVVTTSETVIAKTAVVLKPGFHAVASNGVTFTARIANEGETTQNATEAQDYSVTGLAYDANGNLQALKRNGYTDANGDNAMDDFSYHYDSQKPNQLNYISDANDNSNPNRSADLKNQAPNTYLYNNIGQLSENRAEGIKYVYTASGLVSEVQKNDVPFVRFYYNDKGFRVRKEVYTNGVLSSTHYYVRDVAGSVMAIYSEQTQLELPIYGASRLGVYHKNGATNYELTDHLGNVRAVVTKDNPTPSLFADYYPGGMQMPNRNVVGDYRYGYQGQFAETDPETGKVAFQLRLYDSRINRWLTTDPYRQYASPYLAMGNNWVSRVDPNGGTDTECCDEYDGGMLPEVIVHGSGSRRNWVSEVSFNTPVGWESSFNGTLNDWNQKYGSNFSSHQEAYNSWASERRNPNPLNSKNVTYDDISRWSLEAYTHTAQYYQDTGDGILIVGYGATLTGVGAEAGIPMMAAGKFISGVGLAMSLPVDIYNKNWSAIGVNVTSYITGRIATRGLEKLHHLDKIDDLSFQILDGGVGLKNAYIQRSINDEE